MLNIVYSIYFTLIFLGFLGAIELSILAEYYGREIAAYDIQTTRCDLYGQVSTITLIDTYLDFPKLD